MNLADAIRKAAHLHAPETEPANRAVTEATQEEQVEQPRLQGEAPIFKSAPPVTPIFPELQATNGNAVRLEIFLSGEQMTGMLKAIMAGQHSVLTLREAASYLRISSSSLVRLAEEGEIPAVEIDGRYRFPKSNLDDWLATQSLTSEEDKDVA